VVARVLSVFGTRPEAIKMAPVVRELRRRTHEFESLVCVTAQHREMLDQIMESFELTADFDLNLMQAGQSPAEVASRALLALPPILRRVRPDLVLVQGDTTTTCAAAQAAFLERIPVGHVEAGLRTGDLDQPFPEEMNRRVTTVVSSLHFAPTAAARDALLQEGVASERIVLSGNTVIDALLHTVRTDHDFREPRLAALPREQRLILVTLHRRESIGAPMRDVCEAIDRIAARYPQTAIVIPVHRNPRVREIVLATLAARSNVHLLEPLEYPDFVNLMSRSYLILTDSGGVQEEAPSLKRPVLVLREVTERPEGVAAGVARVVGTDPRTIVAAVEELLESEAAYRAMTATSNPYGDGHAARRIVDAISRWYGANQAPAIARQAVATEAH
jgi:UDP-N-acetylglucosamine 2-epimerase (non-hydrolysing)